MKPNEVSECFRLPTRDRWFASVDAPLGFERPFLRVLASEKGVVDIFPLPSNLDAPGSRFEPCKCRHGVCAPCALRRRTGATNISSWRRTKWTRCELTK